MAKPPASLIPCFLSTALVLSAVALGTPLVAETWDGEESPSSLGDRDDRDPADRRGDGGEDRISDLRLTVGFTPRLTSAHESIAVSDSGQSTTADESVAVSSSLGTVADLQYVGGHLHEHGGFVWGVGLEYARSQLHSALAGGSDGFTALAATTQLGYGLDLDRDWDLEISGFLALGPARSSWHSSPTTTNSATGGYIRSGVRVGTFLALGDAFVLGLQAEYSYVDCLAIHASSSSGSVFAAAGSGFDAQATLGVRF